MEVLANAMVAIILQYISVSNQHTVHLKLMQYYIIWQLHLNKSGGKKSPQKINAGGHIHTMVDIYILPNVKQIASGKQLHSTGRSARCFVTT